MKNFEDLTYSTTNSQREDRTLLFGAPLTFQKKKEEEEEEEIFYSISLSFVILFLVLLLFLIICAILFSIS